MSQIEMGDSDPGAIASAAFNDPSVTPLYMNGFVTATSLGDIAVVVLRNGKPLSVLNMSFTVAKSLALDIGNTIAQVEADTGNTIMTIGQVHQSIAEKKGAL